MPPTPRPHPAKRTAARAPDPLETEVRSHALLSPDVKRHYLAYYRMVFRDGAIDLRTKELIAFAVALATGAPNVAEGHLTKLRKLGASEAEIEEATAVALGVTGASVVDRGDLANAASNRRRKGAKA